VFEDEDSAYRGTAITPPKSKVFGALLPEKIKFLDTPLDEEYHLSASQKMASPYLNENFRNFRK
jgi:hypothetical protein